MKGFAQPSKLQYKTVAFKKAGESPYLSMVKTRDGFISETFSTFQPPASAQAREVKW